jgi:hypothetical protein
LAAILPSRALGFLATYGIVSACVSAGTDV